MSTSSSTIDLQTPRRLRHPALTILAVAGCALVALMLIGAHPTEGRHGSVVSAANANPQPRTDSERAWNAQEDMKAAGNVGQPLVY